MSDENAAPDSGGLATDLAMEEARADSFHRAKVSAYFDRQIALTTLQEQHLREQCQHLHLGIWEKRMGVLLRVATAFVGIAFAAGLVFVIWNAARSNGLLVEPFAVPPEMARRGFTGEVVANQMLAKLIAMQNSTESNRPARSYANNWGDNLRVEIPDTGISVGEAYKFLRQWLGHDTRIGGEITSGPGGIAVTARAEGGGATFTGAETDFDALLQKAAEDVYSRTQPYRYAAFLRTAGRYDEARAIWSRLAESDSPLEQAWAWAGVATTYAFRNDFARAIAPNRRALAAYPTFTLGYSLQGNYENNLGHAEQAFAAYREGARLFERNSIPDLDDSVIPHLRIRNNGPLAILQGDYAEAVRLYTAFLALSRAYTTDRENARRNVAMNLARQHDVAAALAYWDAMPPPDAAVEARTERGLARQRLDMLAAAERSGQRTIMNNVLFYATGSLPNLVLAKAYGGDIAGAEAMIAPTSGDCYPCLRARAQIAVLKGDAARADWWFARAVREAPSLPFAYEDWGRALLARGQADAAIAQFTLANRNGPKFADALEGWGEALMASRLSHLAVAKFAEAEKFAPNWGRLHLKWGQALIYAGKPDEAKAHFARAAGLGLTPSEKAELARMPQ